MPKSESTINRYFKYSPPKNKNIMSGAKISAPIYLLFIIFFMAEIFHEDYEYKLCRLNQDYQKLP